MTRRTYASIGLTATAVLSLISCSGSARSVSPPPADASAATVVHTLMEAYQAGDAGTVQSLTGGTLHQLRPGDLGQVTGVHWRSSMPMKQTYPGFAPGAIYFPFDAATTGSPDQTIPPDKHWIWGFVLARKTPTSRWIAVDDGVG